MKIQLLFFGICTDLAETTSTFISLAERSTVDKLKKTMILTYPGMKNIKEFAIAVNENYSDGSTVLNDGDIVAIIPPVSGG